MACEYFNECLLTKILEALDSPAMSGLANRLDFLGAGIDLFCGGLSYA
jgi:hypothetical protein